MTTASEMLYYYAMLDPYLDAKQVKKLMENLTDSTTPVWTDDMPDIRMNFYFVDKDGNITDCEDKIDHSVVIMPGERRI